MPAQGTAFENFRAFTKKVVAVPKKEIAKREAAYRAQTQRKNTKSK